MFTKETELAAVVKTHLEKQGWDVYPEVELYPGGPRCDLVALKGEKLWAVECKLVVSHEVTDKCLMWKKYANLISVAAQVIDTFDQRVICDYLGNWEIGWLRVKPFLVFEEYHPIYRPIKNTQLLEACRKDHKELGQAGAKSKYYTPYLKLLKAISVEAHREHGQRLEDIVDNLPPHGFLYARIAKSAKDGKIEDCKLWHRNHKDYLYPNGYGPHGKD